MWGHSARSQRQFPIRVPEVPVKIDNLVVPDGDAFGQELRFHAGNKTDWL